MIKLQTPEIDKTILVYHMQDGQIAVITRWKDSSYIGTIVQRFDNKLIALGQGCGIAWSTILKEADANFRVRILEAGETLVIS